MPRYEQGQISASDYLLLHAAVTTAYLFSSGIFKGWVGMMLLCIKTGGRTSLWSFILNCMSCNSEKLKQISS